MGFGTKSASALTTASKKHTYESDVVLGEKYRDKQTGLQGIATAITFHQHACERVLIEFVRESDGKLEELIFDAPRLIHVATGHQATSEKTGGPEHSVTGVNSMSRR